MLLEVDEEAGGLFGGFAFFFLFFVLFIGFEENLGDGLFVGWFEEFGYGSYVAEDFVVGDLFDNVDSWREFVGFGEVGTGDLEGVEEEAGAALADGVGGDAADDFADAALDGGAVFGEGHVEGGFAAGRVGPAGGAAGGVVVVAEIFFSE